MTNTSGPALTSTDRLAIARAVAERSAERYGELAEAFTVSCNPATAETFVLLAAFYQDLAESLPPAPPPTRGALDWFERAPEIADPDSVHYMMLPWHVFDLAQRAEDRVANYWAGQPGGNEYATASKTRRDEFRSRRDSCPAPHPGWWEDQDGPNWDSD